MKSLFELSLLSHTSVYRNKADSYIERTEENNYILTNVLDYCMLVKGDSQAIYSYYISNEYSKMFDTIYKTHETLCTLQELYNK